MKTNFDVAVIGGGASGILSAIEIKKTNTRMQVCIVEKNSRIGKKLLLTGNSKCNLSNENISVEHYHTDDNDFLENIFAIFPPKNIISYFETLGVLCKSDEQGRIYPSSERSSCVLEALRLELQKLKIDIITDFEVVTVNKGNKGFVISSDTGSVFCKNVVFAFGGKAYPRTGSDGKLFDCVVKLGHTVNKPRPALSAIKVLEKDFLRIIQGVRTKGKISVLKNDEVIAERTGEIQFRKDSVSGICSFDLSKYISDYVYKKEKCELGIHIDILPYVSCEVLEDIILKKIRRYSFASIEDILSSVVHRRISIVVLKLLSVPNSCCAKQISVDDVKNIVYSLKCLKFTPCGTYGFEESQVSLGGISCKEVDCYTMKSKNVDNLYIVGEALDVAGDCGGYNLHFAWTSAIICGKAFAP